MATAILRAANFAASATIKWFYTVTPTSNTFTPIQTGGHADLFSAIVANETFFALT